jgi:hypothetical protein
MTTSPRRSVGTRSSPSWTWWRSLRSVSLRSRSSSVSPTQRIGTRPASKATGTFSLSARSVSQKSSRRSECPSTTPSTPSSVSIGALTSPVNAPDGALVHVLREDLRARAARGLDDRVQDGEWDAEPDVGRRGGDPRQQRLHEGLGLGDRLVHLPVAGDQRGPGHASASTPGSGLPSMSSSAAPPPVERCVTRSARPKRDQRRRAVAAADDRRAVARRDGLRDGPRARGERLELERPHRPVPEHAPGGGDGASVGLRGARTDVESHPPFGHVDAVELAPPRLRREAVGEHEVSGQAQLAVPALQQPARRLDALPLAQRVADRMTLGGEERECHRPADEDGVRAIEERVEDPDLLGDLRPADDGDERPRRLAEDPGQRLDLALEQQAGRAREQVGDAPRSRACARWAAPNASLT